MYSLISGLQFFEASAKENINVKAVFERLVDIICDKMAESIDSEASMAKGKPALGGTRLTDAPNSGGNKPGQACNC